MMMDVFGGGWCRGWCRGWSNAIFLMSITVAAVVKLFTTIATRLFIGKLIARIFQMVPELLFVQKESVAGVAWETRHLIHALCGNLYMGCMADLSI